MSILSGYFKTKKYRKTDSGYKLQSEWTNANSIEFDDGTIAQTNLGDIKGITDSLTATSANVALSAAAGNNLQEQITELNTDLGGFSFYPEKLTQAQYDALSEDVKATPGLIFVIVKE